MQALREILLCDQNENFRENRMVRARHPLNQRLGLDFYV